MLKISPRRLPWDVLLLVFKQADPSTLAVLGRVSYDFLTSTTPELYRDVEVTSVKQLEALFCERKDVQAGRKTKNSLKSSRVNPHLSFSQIQTLSIDLTSLASLPDTLSISSSRIDDANPIPLGRLRLSLDVDTRDSAGYLYSSLFPLLNPSRCSYEVVPYRTQGIEWLPLTTGQTYLVEWTRLEVLDMSRVVPYLTPRPLAFPQSLGGLPRPALDRRRVVQLRLSNPDAAVPNLWEFRELLGLDGMQSGSFFLIVETEEQRELAANVIRTMHEFARWRDVFVVEVAI